MPADSASGSSDIERFRPTAEFLDRLDLLISWIRDARASGTEIRGRFASAYSREGIPLDLDTARALEDLASHALDAGSLELSGLFAVWSVSEPPCARSECLGRAAGIATSRREPRRSSR